MPFAARRPGRPQVVLRKVDGAEILRRVEQHGRDAHVRRAGRGQRGARRRRRAGDGPIPGRGTACGIDLRRRAAADPHHRAGRGRARLGVHPDLRAHRDLAAADLQPPPRRVGLAVGHERAEKLGRAGAPALGVQLAVDAHGEVLARSNVVLEGYWASPRPAPTRSPTAGSTPATAAPRRRRLPHISDRKKDVIISGGENVSSIEVEDALCSHPAVAEAAVIGVPDERWGETVKALVVLAPGAAGHRGRAHRPLPRAPGPLQVPDLGRAARRARPHLDRQAAEVQAARALLGGARWTWASTSRARASTSRPRGVSCRRRPVMV
jgi:fatty-acyl-CoA synthase